ncbi:unnamed protein product, partial [Hapterophycus canaliculatus]
RYAETGRNSVTSALTSRNSAHAYTAAIVAALVEKNKHGHAASGGGKRTVDEHANESDYAPTSRSRAYTEIVPRNSMLVCGSPSISALPLAVFRCPHQRVPLCRTVQVCRCAMFDV